MKVDQSPKKSMVEALKPSMNALIKDGFSKHSDMDVKVAVASCISEITRITAPDAPYSDEQMKVRLRYNKKDRGLCVFMSCVY